MAKAVVVEKGSRFRVRFHVDGLWSLSSLTGTGGGEGACMGDRKDSGSSFPLQQNMGTAFNSALHDKNGELQKNSS